MELNGWICFHKTHIFILQSILHIVVNVYILSFPSCQFCETVHRNMQSKQDTLNFTLPGRGLTHRDRCIGWKEETGLSQHYSLSHNARATAKMNLEVVLLKKSPKIKKKKKIESEINFMDYYITIGLGFFLFTELFCKMQQHNTPQVCISWAT